MTRPLAALTPNPARREPRPDLLVRACVADVAGRATRTDPAVAIGRLFGGDKRIAAIHRASTGPLTIADDPELAATTSTFVLGLAPVSAAAALFARALRLDLLPNVAIPGLAPDGATFVAEGAVIPATELPASAPPLAPFKIAALAVISNTLAKRSNAEPLIADALRRSAATVLDAALFGSAAATDEQPAGLLHGVSPLPGWDGGAVDPMLADLGTLADAVGPYGEAAFVASPGTALRINAKLPGAALGSSAVPAGTVIGIVPGALAWGTDPEPEIVGGSHAIVHMADPAAEIVSDAPVTADPVASMWQTDATAVRLLLDVGWSLRSPSAVAFIEGATW